MNEFNPSQSDLDADDPDMIVVPEQTKSGLRYQLLERKYVFGLNVPWLAGTALLTVGAICYLFFPSAFTSSPDVNELAGLTPVAVTERTQPSQPAPQPLSTSPQLKMVDVVQGLKNYSQANRTAIQKLSSTVDGLSQALAAQQQLTAQYQNEMTALKTRQASLEVERVNSPAAAARKPHTSSNAMHLSSVQNGSAWVNWKGKTWAVKEGDLLGKIRIERIDAENAQVFTSAGVIR